MKKVASIFVFTIFMLLVSCRQDFNLQAEYKVVPVVYGLLDANADTNFVKITRSFYVLNDDATQVAMNPDSSDREQTAGQFLCAQAETVLYDGTTPQKHEGRKIPIQTHHRASRPHSGFNDGYGGFKWFSGEEPGGQLFAGVFWRQ